MRQESLFVLICVNSILFFGWTSGDVLEPNRTKLERFEVQLEIQTVTVFIEIWKKVRRLNWRLKRSLGAESTFQEKEEFKEAGRPHKLGRRPPTYFVVSNLEFEIELERKCKELGFEGFIQE